MNKLAMVLLLLQSLYPLFPGPAPSSDDIRFSNITINQGLSQNTVYCILRDRKGFMWFGTEKGLNKYNGRSFNVYRGRPGVPGFLSYDMVLSLHESPSEPGIIWVGTWGGGLNRMDSETESFRVFKTDSGDPSSLNDDTIRVMGEDQTGLLWIGTNEGISSLNRSDRKFKNYPIPLPENCRPECRRILSILVRRDGTLLAGTDGGGIVYFHREKDRFLPAFPQNSPLRTSRIRALAEDEKHRLWAGTFGGGLIHLKAQTDAKGQGFLEVSETIKADNLFIRSLLCDHFGYLWAGTHGGGVIRFHPDSGSLHTFRYIAEDPGSLSNDIVLSMMEDREQVLWIGSFGGGINKYYNIHPAVQRISMPRKPMSKGQNAITALHTAPDGRVWIGTEGGGLSYYNEEEGGIVFDLFHPGKEEGLSGNIIYSILAEGPESLWLGTWGAGLYRFNHITGEIRHYPFQKNGPNSLSSSRIICLSDADFGKLAIGTWGGGLNLLDKKTGGVTVLRAEDENLSVSLSNNKILALLARRDGKLWIGTEEGLNLYNPEINSFRVFKRSEKEAGSISHNRILTIFRDSMDRIWVGTENGLNRYIEETGEFIRFGSEAGLYGESIHGILEDGEKNLWISTNFGLNKFLTKKEKFLFFSPRRGIHRYEFSRAYTASRRGNLMFGGVDGINMVNPGIVEHSRFIPEIVFTSFKKFGKEVHLGRTLSSIEELVLSHRDSIVSFEFAALSFSDPRGNKYAYRIPGLSDHWIYLGNLNQVSLTRLEPGEHQLLVKGSNSDGVWNEKGASIRLTVLPPFWQTWWFRIFIFFLLVCSAFIWHRGRMNRLKNRLKTEHALDRLCEKRNISGREKEVMLLVVKGLSNRQIEDKLFISPHTVKNHIYNIFQKLDVGSRAQLTELFRNLYFTENPKE